MQEPDRQAGTKRGAIGMLLAVPVFAAVLSGSPVARASTPVVAAPSAATTTPAATAWAQSVRRHLGFEASDGAASASAATVPVRPVTAWARAVEARLALRAQRVALVGRAALAWSERGVASWYGRRSSGHRTSSGERFDPMELTCAHPTLPLGTKVLVTSETTGRSVVVTVNDRGPFGGRSRWPGPPTTTPARRRSPRPRRAEAGSSGRQPGTGGRHEGPGSGRVGPVAP